MKRSAMILGEVASSGVARGPAFVCACVEQTTVPRRVINENEISKEMEKLDAAISEAEKELLDLQKKSSKKLGHRKLIFLRPKFFFWGKISHCVRRSDPLSDGKNQRGGRPDQEAIEKLTALLFGWKPLLSRASGRTCGMSENGCLTF